MLLSLAWLVSSAGQPWEVHAAPAHGGGDHMCVRGARVTCVPIVIGRMRNDQLDSMAVLVSLPEEPVPTDAVSGGDEHSSDEGSKAAGGAAQPAKKRTRWSSRLSPQ